VGSGWQEVSVQVPIRSGGRALWVQHPRADVAAIYINVPTELPPFMALVPTTLLASDDLLLKYEIHPGDEVNILGYPLGYSHVGGFPVLRSGKIASYPLVPTRDNPYFLLDFRVFKGNSGGPVYFVQTNRPYGGVLSVGETINVVMGLVSEEVTFTEQFQGQYEVHADLIPLGIAKVISAPYIIETINLLPPPD
jgi:hypothetical protein